MSGKLNLSMTPYNKSFGKEAFLVLRKTDLKEKA